MGPPSVQLLLSMIGRAGGIVCPGVADDLDELACTMPRLKAFCSTCILMLQTKSPRECMGFTPAQLLPRMAGEASSKVGAVVAK